MRYFRAGLWFRDGGWDVHLDCWAIFVESVSEESGWSDEVETLRET